MHPPAEATKHPCRSLGGPAVGARWITLDRPRRGPGSAGRCANLTKTLGLSPGERRAVTKRGGRSTCSPQAVVLALAVEEEKEWCWSGAGAGAGAALLVLTAASALSTMDSLQRPQWKGRQRQHSREITMGSRDIWRLGFRSYPAPAVVRLRLGRLIALP